MHTWLSLTQPPTLLPLLPHQAKALIAWRNTPRPPRAARLSAQDREVLAVQHNRRLFDCASKSCLAVIKAMMVQKVRRDTPTECAIVALIRFSPWRPHEVCEINGG